MKIHVVVFKMKRAVFPAIYNCFEEADITLSEVNTIGKLHDILRAYTIDAVLVRKKTLFLYRINPLQHLGFARSKTTIIGISREKDGSITGKQYRVRQEDDQLTDNTPINDRLTKIQHALRSLSVVKKEKTSLSWHTFFDTSKLHLHKKIALLFELLINAGTNGISVETIQEILWKDTTQSKRSDIQVYVTRLRRLLTDYGTYKTKILYKNNKYYVVM